MDSLLSQPLMTTTFSHFRWILCWVRLSWLRLLPISVDSLLSQTLMTKTSSLFRWILCWVRLSWLRLLPISVDSLLSQTLMTKTSSYFRWILCWGRRPWRRVRLWLPPLWAEPGMEGMNVSMFSFRDTIRKEEWIWGLEGKLNSILLPTHSPLQGPWLQTPTLLFPPPVPSPAIFTSYNELKQRYCTSSPIFEKTVRIGSPS